MLIKTKRLIVSDPDVRLRFRVYLPTKFNTLIYYSENSFVLMDNFISFKRWLIYIPPLMVTLRYKLILPVSIKYRYTGLY